VRPRRGNVRARGGSEIAQATRAAYDPHDGASHVGFVTSRVTTAPRNDHLGSLDGDGVSRLLSAVIPDRHAGLWHEKARPGTWRPNRAGNRGDRI